MSGLFGWVKSNENDNTSLNDDECQTNYNTFIKYDNYGESNDKLIANKDEIECESLFVGGYGESKESLLPKKKNNDNNKKELNKIKILTNKYCEKIITFWIRKYDDNIDDIIYIKNIYNKYSFIYLLTISFCIKYKKIKEISWCNLSKSSIIKLLNTNQTFMIHQDKFRKGRNKKIINFKQLNKYHFIRLNKNIPNIYKCNGILFEIEIYQKYLDFKKYDINIYDRKYSALCGSHKIGINFIQKNNKKKFCGILSYFNYSFKNKYNKYKQNGTIHKIDINGNKKIIKNEIALRKHEIIQIKIDWICKQLIFNRISLKNNKNKIVINNICDNNNNNNNDNICYISCNICINDIDSFMWNDNKDKDYISYTLNAAYLL